MILNFVNFSIGIRGRVDGSAFIHDQRLHLKLLRLKNHRRFAIRCNSIDSRRRTCGRVEIALAIRRDRPDISGWRRGQRRESRSQFQTPGAAYGHAFGRAFDEFVEFRLFPGASAFGKKERMQEKNWKDREQPTQTDQIYTSKRILGGKLQVITSYVRYCWTVEGRYV